MENLISKYLSFKNFYEQEKTSSGKSVKVFTGASWIHNRKGEESFKIISDTHFIPINGNIYHFSGYEPIGKDGIEWIKYYSYGFDCVYSKKQIEIIKTTWTKKSGESKEIKRETVLKGKAIDIYNDFWLWINNKNTSKSKKERKFDFDYSCCDMQRSIYGLMYIDNNPIYTCLVMSSTSSKTAYNSFIKLNEHDFVKNGFLLTADFNTEIFVNGSEYGIPVFKTVPQNIVNGNKFKERIDHCKSLLNSGELRDFIKNKFVIDTSENNNKIISFGGGMDFSDKSYNNVDDSSKINYDNIEYSDDLPF